MSKPFTRKNATERPETEKVPTLVVKRIREAILDEVFKPGDHFVLIDNWRIRKASIRIFIIDRDDRPPKARFRPIKS